MKRKSFRRQTEFSSSLTRQIFVNDQVRNQPFNYPKNFIRTSKYTVQDFLLKSLLYQFMRLSNCYFLMIAVLQSIPQISPLHPFSAIAPLLFVLSLSMLREGIEDRSRHISDKEINSDKCMIFKGKEFAQGLWKDVIVGDFIKIEEMELIPADIVVLSSSNSTGACYIETSSLDGEKNLKPKLAHIETNSTNASNLEELQKASDLQCIPPNSQLHYFEGNLVWAGKKLKLSSKQFLLRGSRLKNTKWVIGIVAYAGPETKIMRNAEPSRDKSSIIEKKTNRWIVLIFTIQVFICIVCAIVSFCWGYVNENRHHYLPHDSNPGLTAFLNFFTYFLLLNTMIPISLVVSLEFVKLSQAYFMKEDASLYTKENGRSLKVFSSALNEELGQIEYIFTDKTGTLTCNRMEFKYAAIGEEIYGQKSNSDAEGEAGDESRAKRRPTYMDLNGGIAFSFEDERLSNLLKGLERPNRFELKFKDQTGEKVLFWIKNQTELIHEYLIALATCHECIVDIDKNGTVNYQGPSPDEIALVDAARQLGVEFQQKTTSSININFFSHTKGFEVLRTFEFDSNRKRMTVVLRESELIKVYTKGADNVIKARLDQNSDQPYLSSLSKSIDDFSKKGLRTLCVAMKVMDRFEYEKIEQEWSESEEKKEKEKDELQKALIERYESNMILIGVTAVEDKLQKKVPETIGDFLKANIKVWMLTGDKLETAENIGKSCNLIQKDMSVFPIGSGDSERIIEKLSEFEEKSEICKANRIKRCFLIEGECLAIILKSKDQRRKFINIVKDFEAVICCRSTPKQKADVVGLVKTYLRKVTLAVGDGANDVNMIQEAHIGVGIYGQEGLRAVQASDYAIGEFKSLWRLILVHGRWSYIRIAEMILYFFYKNIVFTLPQLYFGISCLMSGQSVFDDWYISLFNFIFTMCPLIVKAIFEQDVNFKEFREDKSLTAAQNSKIVKTNKFLKSNYPRLYYVGQRNTIFTDLNFVRWLCQGALETLLLFLFIFYGIQDNITDRNGYMPDLWFYSIIYFTSVILLVNLKLAVHTRHWIFLSWISIFITSLAAYLCYIWIGDVLSISAVQYTAQRVFCSPLFYFTVPLVLVIPICFDYLMLAHESQEKNIINYFKGVVKSDTCLSKSDTVQTENIELRIIDNFKQINQQEVMFSDVSMYSFEDSPVKGSKGKEILLK